jgi:electron transfer flavoprotein beta subunit
VPVHCVVAAKQVLDPDSVNSYALWGRLAVDASGRRFTISETATQLINAYDEQAMEAALRLRDAGVECRITAISVGRDSAADVLKRCVAMGADQAILVQDAEVDAADGVRSAALLAAAIQRLGDVDLVLCGRQGSDYDQGTVPGVLAELLDAALVTLAAEVAPAENGVRVTRVAALGEEVLEASFPAVVSVSNEIGTPRAPTARAMMAARRSQPTVYTATELLAAEPSHGVELLRVFVPDVQGHCAIIDSPTPAAKAAELFQRLNELGAFDG